MGDWTLDLIYKPDVAMIKRSEIATKKTQQMTNDSTLNKKEAQ